MRPPSKRKQPLGTFFILYKTSAHLHARTNRARSHKSLTANGTHTQSRAALTKCEERTSGSSGSNFFGCRVLSAPLSCYCFISSYSLLAERLTAVHIDKPFGSLGVEYWIWIWWIGCKFICRTRLHIFVPVWVRACACILVNAHRLRRIQNRIFRNLYLYIEGYI